MPQYTPVPIIFTKGVNTKADAKVTMPGEWIALENAVFTSIGTLQTRFGSTKLTREIEGSTSTITESDAMAVYGAALLQFSGGRVYSYMTSTSKWVDRGAARSVVVTDADVIRNSYQQSVPDVAELNGVRVYAWEDSRGGVHACIVNAASNEIIVDDTEIHATGTSPRVVAFDATGDVVVLYSVGQFLNYKRVNTRLPSSFGAEVNPYANLKASYPWFDAVAIGDRLFLAVNDNGGTILLYYLSTLYALSASVAIADDADDTIALIPDANTDGFVVAWTNAANSTKASWRTYTMAATTGIVVIEAVASARITGCVPDGSTTCTLFYEVAGSSVSTYKIRTNTLTAAGVAGTAANLRLSVGLSGRAFEWDSIVYVPAVHESPSELQDTTFLLDSSGNIVARIFPSVSGGLRADVLTGTVKTVLPNVIALGSGRFATTALRKTELVTETGVTYTRIGVSSYTLDFATSDRYRTVEAAGTLLIVGGCLQTYDGRAVTEHGFHLYPEGLSNTATGGAGSLSAGDYQYKAVFERTDRTGRVHRSAPSVALEVTATALDRINLTIPTLRLTAASDVRVAIYRTIAGGTTFYRITSPSSPLMNSTTADTVTYQDTASDVSILSNEFLYTTGGIIPNVPPGACSIICNYRGRVFVAGLSDPHRVAFSKIVRDGEPVAFSDLLTFPVDAIGGSITALAALDDKLIIFKETATYVVAGDGPTDSADPPFFSDVALISAEIGSESSVVTTTSAGVLFKSSKGIYLLGHDLSVRYLGDRVEDYSTLDISGALAVPDTNQVRVTHSDGRTLVWDYLVDQWSTFTGAHQNVVGAGVWGGAYTWLRDDGCVFVESSATYKDDTDPVEMYGETGWISMAGIQGFQRVQRMMVLGDYESSHKLRVRVGFDYSPNWLQDKLIDAGTIIGSSTYGSTSPYGSPSTTPYGGRFGRYQFSLHLARQKCQAVRFSFGIEQTGTPVGAAASLTGMTLLVGQKQGLFKLENTRRF